MIAKLEEKQSIKVENEDDRFIDREHELVEYEELLRRRNELAKVMEKEITSIGLQADEAMTDEVRRVSVTARHKAGSRRLSTDKRKSVSRSE
jgi:hypothetical protein